MEQERNYKTQSKVLKVLGIIIAVFSLIAIIGSIAGASWAFPRAKGTTLSLLTAIFGGVDIWLAGALLGHLHHLNKKKASNVWTYIALVAFLILCLLVKIFVGDFPLIGDSLSFGEIILYVFAALLGTGIGQLHQARNGNQVQKE